MRSLTTALLLASLNAIATPVIAQAPAPTAAPAATNPALTQALAEAQTAYRARKMKAEEAALNKAAAIAPKDFTVLWRQARHYFTMAEASRSDDVKERLGKKAWGFADRAIKINPNKPHGWFWASAGVGQYSIGAGIITAIRKGIASKFERYARSTIRLSKRYESGGGYRALGRYYFTLPWPKRDLEKSIALLRKAVKFGPHKARNYAWLAESLLKDGEDDDAKKILNKCATLNPNREDPADGRHFKRVCAKLLKDM